MMWMRFMINLPEWSAIPWPLGARLASLGV
jgi:hypothetical protein